MEKKQLEQTAEKILEAVGGKGNVQSVFHCVTRLRFVLKDNEVPDIESIKKIEGVLGAQFSGGQFQVIIGPNVTKVYEALCRIGHFDTQEAVEEKEEAAIKTPFSLKKVGTAILDGLTGSITPALPAIICGGLLKMVVAILGPTMLNLLPETSGIYTILTFAGDSAFYFLPVILGYTSAKKFKANPIIGMLLGAILLHPTLIQTVTEGKALDFLGLPITGVSYASSVIPIILIVWLSSYIERFLNKHIPEMFKMMLVPLLTVLVMLPIGLGILGPLGSILGNYISGFLLWTHTVLGPIGIGLIAAVFALLIVTGMHHAINMAVLVTLASVGYDEVVFVAVTSTVISIGAAALAFALRAKKPANKSLGFSSFVLQMVAGVAEPTLYGVMLPYVKPFIGQAIGAFCGGVYMGIMHVKVYALTASNIFILAGFIGKDAANFMHAIIGSVISFVVTFAAVWILGFDEK